MHVYVGLHVWAFDEFENETKKCENIHIVNFTTGEHQSVYQTDFAIKPD